MKFTVILGKSTLLTALSGKLAPSNGKRIEGDGLKLGVFTQDLAQDLDQEAYSFSFISRRRFLSVNDLFTDIGYSC